MSENHDQSTMYTDIFGKYVIPVGVAEVQEVHVMLESSEVLQELCGMLWNSMEELYRRQELPFSEDELHAAVVYLVEARCAYVFGIKGGRHPRDVEYPSMFGPVLAAIGRFRDDHANVMLIPAPARLVDYDATTQRCVAKKNVRPTPPDGYDRLMMSLRNIGVPTSVGLPMDKDVPTDDFYRVEVRSSILCGSSRQAPSPITLFSRVLVNMSYLETLFGSARVTYAAVDSMRMGMRDLVLKNVDGIRDR